MSGWFAADIHALGAHRLNHITIADFGPLQDEVLTRQELFQPHVRHDRRDDAAAFQGVAPFQKRGDQGEDLVAIDDPAFLVADDHPIRVAVKRNADVGPILKDGVLQFLRRRRAAFPIDVEAVRLDANRFNFGAEFPKHRWSDLIGGAIGAIDDHAQSLEREPARECVLREFDVSRRGVFDPLYAAEIGRCGESSAGALFHHPLNAQFGVVRQLVAVRAEELYANYHGTDCETR